MKRFNIDTLALVYIRHGQPDLLGWVHATLCRLAVINRDFSLNEYLVILDQPPASDTKYCIYVVAGSL